MPDLSSSLRELIERASPPVDVDAIVRGRRRRRVRRRGAIGVAAVVIAAVVTVGVVTRPSPDRDVVAVGGSKPSEADATRAALDQLTILSPGGGSGASVTRAPDTITLTDAGSARAHAVPFPLANAQGIDYPFLSLGSSVAFVVGTAAGPHDGTAYVASSTLQQWRALGPASAVFAAADPDHVWLETEDATSDQARPGHEVSASHSVHEVGLDGASAGTSFPLTNLRLPLAGVSNGLLLTQRPGPARSVVYEVWNPATNRVLRRLAIGGVPTAVSSRFAAWISDACVTSAGCALHVTDVGTGADRVVAPPAGKAWWEASFAPDGTRLAAVAVPPYLLAKFPPAPKPGDRVSDLTIIDTNTGRLTTRALPAKNRLPLNPMWSPDGALVFVARDGSHLAYVNPAFPRGPVRSLPVDLPWEALVATKALPAATTPRYEYDGLVSQSPQHSAELCIYPTALTNPPPGGDGCNGPLVVGWDWSKVAGETRTRDGVISGNYRVVGTYDGDAITLTESPTVARPPRTPAAPDFKTPCAAPAGGWEVTDPARVSFDDYTAFTNAARNDPEFAGLWIDQSTAPAGAANDFAHDVFNVGFTGHLQAHRAQLAGLWGGPICVVPRAHSYADLQRIGMRLIRGEGRALGLQVIESGPDDVNGTVHVEVVAADDATQRAVDERYGAGVVKLTSRLRPVS